MPADTPVTIPVEPTVETPVAPELHVPPDAVLLRVVVAATQTVAVPVMEPALGEGFTVTSCVVLPLHPPLLAE